MEEARKKRTFFPEDKVNSDHSFHLCLLCLSLRGLLVEALGVETNSPRNDIGYVKQKSLHPHQGRRVTPRYHPGSSLVSCLLGSLSNLTGDKLTNN